MKKASTSKNKSNMSPYPACIVSKNGNIVVLYLVPPFSETPQDIVPYDSVLRLIVKWGFDSSFLVNEGRERKHGRVG